MKNIILALSAFSLLVILFACDEPKGYLMTDDAKFTPDSMIIHVVPLKTDVNQYKYATPWYSTAIEGVEGTLPVVYSIADVTTTDGDVESFKQWAQIKEGVGKVYVPLNHKIKPGSYMISVKVSNIYKVVVLKDVFKLIVQ
ncbi:MAG: hypothetical protein Q8859_09320 [Bacteroidota bacterium]|nr:hypothetical protein [Bacteroidota bacterium]